MIFSFKHEDPLFYGLATELGITQYLNSFLTSNIEQIYIRFESMLKETENKIEEVSFDEFCECVNFTFVVIFAKNLIEISHGKDLDTLVIAAQSLAKKMAIQPEKEEYLSQLDKILEICCNSIPEAISKNQ